MMKSKHLTFGILAIMIAGIIFTSGCVQESKEKHATDQSTMTLTEVGSYQCSEGVREVYITGTNVITTFVNVNESGYEIWDISDPATPTRLALKLLKFEQYGEVHDMNPSDIFVVNDTLYIASNYGLYACNIQDPAHPTDPSLVYNGGEEYQTQPIETVMITNNLAYVIGYVPIDYGDYTAIRHGFGVIDISDGNLIGSYESSSVEHSLYVASNYVYMGTLDSLEILDITNPYNPVCIGQYSTGREIIAITVRDNYAYLGEDNYIQVVDVSNPASPTLVKELDVWGTVGSLCISGNRLFVGSQELTIFDIAEPASPKLLVESSDISLNLGYTSVYADNTHVVCSGFDYVDGADRATYTVHIFEYQ